MVEINLGAINADIPKDLFLTLRINDVQKFAKASVTKGYKFPASIVAGKKYGRLEIYRRVGSRNIVIDPEKLQGLHELDVPLDYPDLSSLTFRYEMQQEQGNGAANGKDGNSKPDLGEKHHEIQEYLAKHQIEEQMMEAMQALLKQRPDNPAQFIAEMLLSGAGRITKVEDKPAPQMVPSPDNQQTAPTPPSHAPPEMAESGAPEQALLVRISDALHAAASDGRLMAALQPTAEAIQGSAPAGQQAAAAAEEDTEARMFQAMRLRMAEELDAAAHDGRLLGALEADDAEDALETLRLKTQSVFFQAAEDGSLDATLSALMAGQEEAAPSDNSEVLRAQARRTLAEATGDGRLAATLLQVRGRPKSQEQQEQQPQQESAQADQPADDLESLRVTTRDLLSKAMENGSLEEQLARLHTFDDEELEKQEKLAKDAAVDTAEQEKMSRLISLCREALISGADDGSLNAAVEEVKSSRLDGGQEDPAVDFMALCREALISSADDGSLDAAIEHVKSSSFQGLSKEDEQEQAPDFMALCREALISSADDGTLDAAIEHVKSPTFQGYVKEEGGDADLNTEDALWLSGEAEEVGNASSVEGEDDLIDSLIADCREAILLGADDGSLGSALEHVKSSGFDLRQETAGEPGARPVPVIVDGSFTKYYAEHMAPSLFPSAAKQSAPSAQPEDLRTRCRDVLVEASSDGRLESALVEIATPTMNEDPHAQLKETCRDILMQASIDGRLDSALAGVGSPAVDRSSIDDLRVTCRSVLIKACEEGTLTSELTKILDHETDKAGTQQSDVTGMLSTLTSEEAKVLKEENMELRRTVEDLKVAVKRLEERFLSEN